MSIEPTEDLYKRLNIANERADYALRNTRAIDAHRMEFEKRKNAEIERLRDLLRRGLNQLYAWQEKYGEHNPDWLPPPGDVQWAEDVSEALATPND